MSSVPPPTGFLDRQLAGAGNVPPFRPQQPIPNQVAMEEVKEDADDQVVPDGQHEEEDENEVMDVDTNDDSVVPDVNVAAIEVEQPQRIEVVIGHRNRENDRAERNWGEPMLEGHRNFQAFGGAHLAQGGVGQQLAAINFLDRQVPSMGNRNVAAYFIFDIGQMNYNQGFDPTVEWNNFNTYNVNWDDEVEQVVVEPNLDAYFNSEDDSDDSDVVMDISSSDDDDESEDTTSSDDDNNDDGENDEADDAEEDDGEESDSSMDSSDSSDEGVPENLGVPEYPVQHAAAAENDGLDDLEPLTDEDRVNHGLDQPEEDITEEDEKNFGLADVGNDEVVPADAPQQQ